MRVFAGASVPVRARCTVQGARVDLMCLVLRAHSQLGDVRMRIGRRHSTRTTRVVRYRYWLHGWSSSHTTLHVCLNDCALCDHAGVLYVTARVGVCV